MPSWYQGLLGNGCSAAKWMTTSKVQNKYQWSEFLLFLWLELTAYWVTSAVLLMRLYPRWYSPLGNKTLKVIEMPRSVLEGFEHVATEIKGILVYNGNCCHLAAIGTAALLQASTWDKYLHDACFLLKVISHNFLFASISPFGQGAQDRQGNRPAGRDVLEVHWPRGRDDLCFSSLYLPVFPMFVNSMEYLEANSTLFHNQYTTFPWSISLQLS